MKTPFSIYLAGVLECIGGVLVLLSSVVMTYGAFAAPMPSGGPGLGFLLSTAAVYGLLGVLGIVTGICLCMRRNWARWSTLIFSWFSLFMFALLAVVFLVIPVRQSLGAVKILLASACMAIAATCGWWAWLFNRPRIKKLFAEGGGEMAEPRRPVSVSVIAWLWIISAGMMLAMAAFPFAVGIWVLTGWKAAAVKVVWSVADIVLGWGLLKLREWARQGSIAIIGLVTFNRLVFYGFPGSGGRLQEILDRNPFRMQQTPAVGTTANMIWLGAVVGSLAILIPLYFLITRKAAFGKVKGEETESIAS
jgi:hypothetical protein